MSRRSTPTRTSPRKTSRPSTDRVVRRSSPPGPDGIARGAVFDPTLRYRYLLTRRWDAPSAALASFILLNPSTADEHRDDPTIRRCIRFAQSWGFGGLDILNLYAFRATRPADLFAQPEPVGRDTDRWIARSCRGADLVVLGWGAHAARGDRARRVLTLIAPLHPRPRCLGTTAQGHPRHPLYLRASTPCVPFTPRA